MRHFPAHVLVCASRFLMKSHRSLEIPRPLFNTLPSVRTLQAILVLTIDFLFISIDRKHPDSNEWAPNLLGMRQDPLPRNPWIPH